MARRGWDDRWQRYPESVPLPTADGLATSKQRGAMAATWWSRRFVDVLESFGLGTRMQRGRRYARAGQVLSFDVQPGILVAQVQGSRRTPYVVTVAVARADLRAVGECRRRTRVSSGVRRQPARGRGAGRSRRRVPRRVGRAVPGLLVDARHSL